MSWLGALAFAALAMLATIAYLATYFRWEARETRGLAYFGRPPAERRARKRRIARYSGPAVLLLRVIAVLFRRREMPHFRFRGVAGPPAITTAESFRRASEYRPTAHDVFVVTQMRSGTTWMQQLVFQIATRGEGELGGPAAPHLYAISPWLESDDGVPVQEAPTFGAPPMRIVKTHLPSALCPYDARARYIYVARDPLACFASVVAFNRALAGPLVPPLDAMARWFCSDAMYWSPWPLHVAGWWDMACSRDNVLFVHFEEMMRDFASVRERVATFLGVALSPEAARRVDEKCSLRYMSAHEEDFEMARPTMFSVRGGRFLGGARAEGARGLPHAIAAQILDYCRDALRDSRYPAGRFYPDLAARSASVPELVASAP